MSSKNGPNPKPSQDIFMPKNITEHYITGIEKITTSKKRQQNSLENMSFTNAVGKRQQRLKCLVDFQYSIWLLSSYDYLILTFHWSMSAG